MTIILSILSLQQLAKECLLYFGGGSAVQVGIDSHFDYKIFTPDKF